MRAARLAIAALGLLASATSVQASEELTSTGILQVTAAEISSRPMAAQWKLRLPDGAAIVAELESASFTRPGGFTWYGRVAGDPTGSVALAVQDGAVVGVVHAAGRVYRLRSLPGGLLTLGELEQAPRPLCEVTDLPAPGSAATEPGPARASGPVLAASTDTVVDVMVLWTPRSETALGGPAASQATVDLAVLETNVAFDNSLVALDLRLVHSGPVIYAETGNMALDLDRLRDPDDGYMDEVHGWRDMYGADSVSLFVNIASACGRSYNMGAPPSVSFAPNAFSLVHHPCATGYYAFAHELGHGWGLDHDHSNTLNTPSWPWAYGFQLPSAQYFTIMALSPGGAAQRVQYFSNPNLTFMGEPLGMAEATRAPAYCARALNDNAPIISAFRPTAPEAYCTAGVSAAGCQALMSASGTASASATSGFLLQASGVEGNKEGLFFIGLNGRQANPWGNGTSLQCVVPPVFRGGLLGSSGGTVGQCDGSFSQDWNALWCSTCPKPAKNPGAGAVVSGQLWYRDPQNTSNQTTSLSDAIEFHVVP
jgi:hypothetical protein